MRVYCALDAPGTGQRDEWGEECETCRASMQNRVADTLYGNTEIARGSRYVHETMGNGRGVHLKPRSSVQVCYSIARSRYDDGIYADG